MKVVFDTSVLVAAFVEPHPRHPWAFSRFKKALSREWEFIVCTHTVAELFAVLSTLPVRPRIGPAQARLLIQENVAAKARMTALSAADYRKVVNRTADLGVSGGAVYDALIARAAEKAKADRLVTLNPKDFLRIWPQGRDRIESP